MKKLLTLTFVVVVAVFLGLFLKNAPGYVLLAYKSTVVELSLWTSIIILILSCIILYKLIHFIKAIFRLPQRTSHWLYKRKQHKIFNKTSKGLLKLAEGNFKEALNLLSSSAKYQKKPLINYLTAAKAAQELDDVNKRDEFLRLAFECSPKSGLSIGLMQANLQFDNHEFEAALATLNNLVQKYGNNKVILRQLLKTYINLKDWYNVVKLIPELSRYRIFSEEEILSYEIDAATNYFILLANKNNFSDHDYDLLSRDIDLFYSRELSKKAKADTKVIKSYIDCMLAIFQQNKSGLNNEVYEILVNKSLDTIEKYIYNKSSASDIKNLFELYGDLAFHAQHFKRFEKQLKYHEYNTDLLFNLGKLAIKLADFDKAYQYLNQAQKIASDNKKVQYYLAFVLLKLDKKQQGYDLFDKFFSIQGAKNSSGTSI